ncbi:RBP1 protein, partial [Corvus moneduloides]
CFLLLTSSPSERCRNNGSTARAPSSEGISPTIFPGLNSTTELSPPHDSLCEPPDIVSDDKKE